MDARRISFYRIIPIIEWSTLACFHFIRPKSSLSMWAHREEKVQLRECPLDLPASIFQIFAVMQSLDLKAEQCWALQLDPASCTLLENIKWQGCLYVKYQRNCAAWKFTAKINPKNVLSFVINLYCWHVAILRFFFNSHWLQEAHWNQWFYCCCSDHWYSSDLVQHILQCYFAN